MDRKRSRSNSGWRRLSASARTRSLKASHDSSRLIKRDGDSGSIVRKSTICALGCALLLAPVLTLALLTRFTYGGRQPGFYRRDRADVMHWAQSRRFESRFSALRPAPALTKSSGIAEGDRLMRGARVGIARVGRALVR